MRRKVIFFNPPVLAEYVPPAPTGGTLVQTVQLNLGDGTWNTDEVDGWTRWCSSEGTAPLTTILNDDDETTGWSLGRPATNGVGEGVVATSTATGYPVGVTEKLLGNGTDNPWYLSGLTDSYTYEFDFFASQTRTFENVNGTTTYDIDGDSVSILHKNYYGDVETISSVSPSSGKVVIDITKGGGASNWYLSTMVIREYS